jgi:hypothetical protein
MLYFYFQKRNINNLKNTNKFSETYRKRDQAQKHKTCETNNKCVEIKKNIM